MNFLDNFSCCRYIVGLAGPPGAGKTTLASEVACRLNKLWSKSVVEMGEASPHEVAVVLPMDGFHLYRSQLDAMDVRLCVFDSNFCFLLVLLHRKF